MEKNDGMPDCCFIMLLPVIGFILLTVGYYSNSIIESLRLVIHSPWFLITIGVFLCIVLIISIGFFVDIFLNLKGFFPFRQRLKFTSDAFFHGFIYAYSGLPANLRTEELTLAVLNHIILTPNGVVILESVIPEEHWSNIRILSRFFTASCTRAYKRMQSEVWVIDIPEQTYESGGGYTEHVEEEGHWKGIAEEGNFLSFYNNRPAVAKYRELPTPMQEKVLETLPWYLREGLTKGYVSLFMHGKEVRFAYYGGSNIDDNP